MRGFSRTVTLPVELPLLQGSCPHSSRLTEVGDGASSSSFGVYFLDQDQLAKSVQLARSELLLQEIADSLDDPGRRDNPERLEAQRRQTILHVASFKYQAYKDEKVLRSAVIVSGARTPVRQTHRIVRSCSHSVH